MLNESELNKFLSELKRDDFSELIASIFGFVRGQDIFVVAHLKLDVSCHEIGWIEDALFSILVAGLSEDQTLQFFWAVNDWSECEYKTQ